jgi:hypothetical protein
MGEWLEYVLVEPRYYSTLMTRIPVLIARMLKVKVRNKRISHHYRLWRGLWKPFSESLLVVVGAGVA